MHGRVFAMVAMISLVWSASARAGNEAEVAEHLIELVNIGRGVVTEYQATINGAAREEKGFTSDFVADQVLDRFKEKTKIDLRIPDVVPQAGLYLALVEAEREVVDEAQSAINRQGVGFKGFFHAVFARRVGEHFYRKTGIRRKLTGINYRSPNSKPDAFEQEVLRMFSDRRHPKDQAYSRNTVFEGKPVLRRMDPEYAAAPCLSCHGRPKGERAITGVRKDGWKEGSFAGAVSLILPLR